MGRILIHTTCKHLARGRNPHLSARAVLVGGVRSPAPPSAGDEVLGSGMVADDRRGGLFRLVLEPRLLVHLDADATGVEQLGDLLVVLEVGAGGIAPGVAAAPILLVEQPGQGW